MRHNKDYQVTELGIRTPKEISKNELDCGEVGYLCAQIKDIHDVHCWWHYNIGPIISRKPLPGYKKYNLWFIVDLSSDSRKYGELKDALEKYVLMMQVWSMKLKTSKALGLI